MRKAVCEAMDSRGDSGTDSNKGNVNGVEGMEADSKNVQSMPIYSDLQPEARAKDYVMSPNGTVVGMSSTTGETSIQQLKPLLEFGNALSQPSTIQYGRDVNQFLDEKKPSTSTSLTMSLGLYHTGSVEPDTNVFSVYNMAGLSMNHLDPNSDQMKIHGPGPIRAKPRQLLPKQSPVQQVHHPDIPKQPQVNQLNHMEAPKEPPPQAPLRVARPPVEGRGRNQLLPRYWPRITDQELQQITAGDSNSTIVPLFEKMLSASDAGRIGRLVLPKACAEAYFPPISQPEGLPLTIQDVSGKNWTFQFRFWPNNNSRMYVLEGVTPCIQSMQLQAGDTVTFSRLEPEGKLVMGYRRAPSSLSSQENTGASTGTTTSTPPNLMGNGNLDNFSSIAGLSGLLSQSIKNLETHTNGHLNLSDTGYGWYKPDKGGQKAKDGSLFNTLVASDKKKSKAINVKSKQSLTDTDESIEFRISWEEAQDLLRSPPNVSPRIVKIEGYDFEEFEEPPILGKRTIFTSKSPGPGEDQWAQCDDCGSWRKLPADVFLPSRWVCSDNVWDKERNSCNAEQELDNEEIEFLVQHIKEVKKKEEMEPTKATETASGLEALANAATAGESSAVSTSPAATTKHPRHRPGCTCIVCIQPPSGKGPKHKPTCNCNVCLTVKRRFKTLMMRRKKKQSEREAEHAARKKRPWTKEDNEVSSCVRWPNDSYGCPEGISRQGSLVMAFPNALSRIPSFPAASGNRFPSNPALQIPYAPRSFVDELKGHIDLNNQPDRDEDPNRNAYRVSMMRLLQTASHPLESYLKEQGLTSLVGAQQIMHPALSFGRSMVEREADKHPMNQPSTMLSTDPTQDDLHMSLAMPRFEMATD